MRRGRRLVGAVSSYFNPVIVFALSPFLPYSHPMWLHCSCARSPTQSGFLFLNSETAPKSRSSGSQSQMMSQAVAAVKSRTEVDNAAKAVHKFLLGPETQLRAILSALSDGGVYFVSNVHCKAACTAVRFRKETEDAIPGISAEEFVVAIQGRLCE